MEALAEVFAAWAWLSPLRRHRWAMETFQPAPRLTSLLQPINSDDYALAGRPANGAANLEPSSSSSQRWAMEAHHIAPGLTSLLQPTDTRLMRSAALAGRDAPALAVDHVPV